MKLTHRKPQALLGVIVPLGLAAASGCTQSRTVISTDAGTLAIDAGPSRDADFGGRDAGSLDGGPVWTVCEAAAAGGLDGDACAGAWNCGVESTGCLLDVRCRRGVLQIERTCDDGGLGATCVTDDDCRFGAEWCVQGMCIPCDNTGMICDIGCAGDWTTYERHGCSPCACAPPNECDSDASCGAPGPAGTRCWAGSFCADWCPPGDPSCCFGGNTCSSAGCDLADPRGCFERGCPLGEACADVGCASGGCVCEAGGSWVCLPDCGGGSCEPLACTSLDEQACRVREDCTPRCTNLCDCECADGSCGCAECARSCFEFDGCDYRFMPHA